jgi:4-carboxymuconolactone decarboxylase
MKTWIEQRSGYDGAAIAAREADITGKPQRIEPLTELSPEARDLVVRIRASIGSATGAIVPEYFRTLAKHQEIFRCQLEMGTAIFKGQVPPRERELAVLRIGWLMRAPYEWGEHVSLGKRYGLTTEEIERVIHGSAAPGWSRHEAAILSAVEQLLTEQAINDDTWATLAAGWNEPQLLEFTMIVGQYVSIALVQNALRVRLASGNPGLTSR